MMNKIKRHNELKLGSFLDKQRIATLQAEVSNKALTPQDRVASRIELDDVKEQYDLDRAEQQAIFVDILHICNTDPSQITKEVFNALECENIKGAMLWARPDLLTTPEEWQQAFTTAHSQDFRLHLATINIDLVTEENCLLAESEGHMLFRELATAAAESRKQMQIATQSAVEDVKKKK